MNNEKQETISDIVREMRTLGRLDEKSTDKIPRSLQALGLRTYADRIESAAKRECEETREKSSRVGNQAKMREALSDACYAMFNFLKTQNGCYKEMAKALDKAKATLAEQPRNCDVGTAYAQAKRHKRWCDSHTCRSTYSCALCFAKWANKPYEEGGAE